MTSPVDRNTGFRREGGSWELHRPHMLVPPLSGCRRVYMLAVAFKEKLFLELNLGYGDKNQSEEGDRSGRRQGNGLLT